MSRSSPAAPLGLAVLATLAAAPPVLAETVELPTITIEGRRTGPPRGSLTSPDIDTQREEVNRTAGAVSHIDAETWRDSYAATLRDVLKETPGVLVQTRYSRLPNGGELFLDVRNLLDRRFISDFAPVVLYSPATTATFYPGTGRSIHGGLRMTF